MDSDLPADCVGTIEALASATQPDAEHLSRCSRCADLTAALRQPGGSLLIPIFGRVPAVSELRARHRVRVAGNIVSVAAGLAALLFAVTTMPRPDAAAESADAGQRPTDPDLLALAGLDFDEPADVAGVVDDPYGADVVALLDPFAGADPLAEDDFDLTHGEL